MAGSKTDHIDSELRRSCAGRECPSTNGAPRQLITHRIGTDLCLQRQRENYHKCHRCVYRGKPASFEIEAEDTGGSNGQLRKPN